MSAVIRVVLYDEQYRDAFVDFNTQWILSAFGSLDAEDRDVFSHVEERIRDGAMVFFALDDGVPVATCMVNPLGGGNWEICKLGSSNEIPHPGAGRKTFEACMEWATSHGAKRVLIVMNSRFTAAIDIFRRYGFREIKSFIPDSERHDVAFEYIV